MSILPRCTSIIRSHARQTQLIPRIFHRHFHASGPLAVIKPYILADIGEGIKEVQIIQWFVEPEARVEQFDKICEVQSDKAATDITSRFDGVIKKLHYQADDMVQVGKALCDIDVQSDISPEDEAVLAPPAEQAASPDAPRQPQKAAEQHQERAITEAPDQAKAADTEGSGPQNKQSRLATPAVRGLLKDLKVDILQVTGTGKDGRVLKEDVHAFAAARYERPAVTSQQQGSCSGKSTPASNTPQIEEIIKLTPIQSQMFKTMTRSLSIPHFLFADEIDVSALTTLRRKLKGSRDHSQKLSSLAFIIKAVSLALNDFPLLNARVDNSDGKAPKLLMRQNHNIGVAIDTPQGLLVPNIKNVQAHSITSIAANLSRLQDLALAGKLSANELTGGTITVSNIGSIGGTYVAPVIVQSEVAILGVGKARMVPAFGENEEVVRKDVMNFSWSADHRVVDGATMARMAEHVRGYVEEPAGMLVGLR